MSLKTPPLQSPRQSIVPLLLALLFTIYPAIAGGIVETNFGPDVVAALQGGQDPSTFPAPDHLPAVSYDKNKKQYITAPFIEYLDAHSTGQQPLSPAAFTALRNILLDDKNQYSEHFSFELLYTTAVAFSFEGKPGYVLLSVSQVFIIWDGHAPEAFLTKSGTQALKDWKKQTLETPPAKQPAP